MTIAFPSQATLAAAFAPATPFPQLHNRTRQPTGSRHQVPTGVYGAWSVAEDAKNKASQLSDAAVKEFEKASDSAQSKAGKIEMHSAKYYAACVTGGILACVGPVTVPKRAA